jgi:hypothetical protein
LGLETRGVEGLAWEAEDDFGDQWAMRLCSAPGLAVGGGTDEIVLTIVAERVLGLPREPKLADSKSVPPPPATESEKAMAANSQQDGVPTSNSEQLSGTRSR